MKPNTPPHRQRQIARKKEQQQKRRLQRVEMMQRQQRKAEANILCYMRQRLNVLQGTSLQVIIHELAISPQVTHGIILRQSDTRSYFELMTVVVRDMIKRRLIECHEEECRTALGLTRQLTVEPSPTKLMIEAMPETEAIKDWSILRITKCTAEIRGILAEY